MIERHAYPVSVEWIEGKEGHAGSRDGLPPVTVAAPPEFGGPPHQWSPEHLFVASIASCFMTTLLAIAVNSKLEIRALDVTGIGTLVRGEDRRYSIPHVLLRPRVTLAREADRAKAGRLIEKADQACLISRSVASKIEVDPTLEVVTRVEPHSAARGALA